MDAALKRDYAQGMSTKAASLQPDPIADPHFADSYRGEWTDEELEAMFDEGVESAEREGTIDGEAFARQFLEETRQMVVAKMAGR